MAKKYFRYIPDFDYVSRLSKAQNISDYIRVKNLFKRTKISAACKAAAKKKFKVWPSAYASGWGVRCTRAGGPGKMGKSKKK